METGQYPGEAAAAAPSQDQNVSRRAFSKSNKQQTGGQHALEDSVLRAPAAASRHARVADEEAFWLVEASDAARIPPMASTTCTALPTRTASDATVAKMASLKGLLWSGVGCSGSRLAGSSCKRSCQCKHIPTTLRPCFCHPGE